ncbi:ABC transporter substrate-binding protein [Dactylosporangium sucinum]|uniref:ABC transporter substrate-binding protein n=1 Tax=Dactylosporangium sucinum TaxID=1424081 RepID=A0A917T8F2_9ACTN|nr:extracellular solute-binding protein [Dactylosporangium sucinum]GGM14337.1 ABC transporter substrate-binding protein [Dactylosporangium sucinum]
MNVRLTRRSALGLFGLSTLAACAPSTSAPTPAGTEGLKDDGVKEFPLTSWSYNEAVTKQPMTDAIAKYTSANAGVKITTPSYPYNDYLNQLLLQVQGGQLTGAVQLDVAWLATLAATGKLLDLKSVATGLDYAPAALSLGQSGGAQYGLPWTFAGIGLISNQELLTRAGVTAAPKTVAEFEAALTAVKGLGGGVVPWAGMTKVDQLKDIIPWMWEFGSPIVQDGRIVIGDDGSVEALTWYKKLYDQKLIAPDVNRVDARALMSQGKTAFYEDAIGGKATVTKSSPDKDLGAKMVPVARPVKNAGDKPRHLAWGQVIAVVNGAGAAAAANFAKTVTTDRAYTIDWFTKTGLPPTTNAGLADSAVKNDKFATDFTAQIGANSSASPFWIYPQFSQMEKVLAEEVQSILIGKKTPKDALNSARDRMNALIK